MRTRASLINQKRPKPKGEVLGPTVDPDDYVSGPTTRGNIGRQKRRPGPMAAKALANPGVFGGGTLEVPKSSPAPAVTKAPMPTRKPKAASKPKSVPKKSAAKKEGFDFGAALARGFGGEEAWKREKKKAGVRD